MVSRNFPVCVSFPMHVPRCASLSLDTCNGWHSDLSYNYCQGTEKRQ